MKNKYIVILLALFIFSACRKGDELYISPNEASNPTPAVMLTALEVNTFQNAEGELARLASTLVQHTAGATAQYQAYQNYDITEGDFNNQWEGLYSGTLMNAKLLMESTSEANPHYAGIARILMALNLGIATDLWGDVPYSEALQGMTGNFTAKYDRQEDILNSIQSLLDNAISDLAQPESANVITPGSDDIIFEGDTELWTKAAWTLKARYANRLSKKNPTGSATNVLTYLSKGFAAMDENLEAKHSSESLNQWGAFQNQRAGNLVVNQVFISSMQSNSDPRLSFFVSEAKGGGYVGGNLADEQINTNASTIGKFFKVDQNYPILTYYEAKFLEAEAKVRLGQDASGALNEAIRASVNYVTKGANNGSSIATYTASTANLQNVMTEKWKAMFGQLEAYNDYRRTGIPSLTPRPGAAGAIREYIPVRFPTPQTERQNNPNAPIIELNVPVWWATN
ncbi:SusD/RagB family nutrient-binding outer membrane lipoprotein [Desertivirga brevis]|uniref:SusD/RagB family nutrient-binding outer membrane lipoprotein n=1 Tax=Desertivirga brevis TaxID=2810310 RepID=UPI001A95B8DB|nr:SusD/RagB family nutrient-binding outer membrane lipoprotein [Pedobacter sp. SYSU D00873]